MPLTIVLLLSFSFPFKPKSLLFTYGKMESFSAYREEQSTDFFPSNHHHLQSARLLIVQTVGGAAFVLGHPPWAVVAHNFASDALLLVAGQELNPTLSSVTSYSHTPIILPLALTHSSRPRTGRLSGCDSQLRWTSCLLVYITPATLTGD